MHIVLENVLSQDQIEKVKKLILNESFIDGKATSTLPSKNNLQLPADSPVCQEAGAVVTEALKAHELFNLAAHPQFILPPLFSRYEEGMEYPDHVDRAIMRGRRTDISVTVFLNEPETYSGGELVIDTGCGEQSYRLKAGDAISYPSTTMHHVAQVTQGTRLVAVVWVQSLVRDPAKRQILFDLGSAVNLLSLAQSCCRDTVLQSYWNLMRLWAET